MVVPLWFVAPQFPPSIIKKKKQIKETITVDGYEADFENKEKILPSTSKMYRKSKQINVIFEQETCDKVNPIMSVMQQEDISLFSESSEWEYLSEFEV